jgi:hypothetical protein
MIENFVHFFYVSTALGFQGLLVFEFSGSPSDIPPSVVLLWKSDRPDTETYTVPDNKQHSKETDIHAPCEFRTCNRNNRQTSLNGAATRIGYTGVLISP